MAESLEFMGNFKHVVKDGERIIETNSMLYCPNRVLNPALPEEAQDGVECNGTRFDEGPERRVKVRPVGALSTPDRRAQQTQVEKLLRCEKCNAILALMGGATSRGGQTLRVVAKSPYEFHQSSKVEPFDYMLCR